MKKSDLNRILTKINQNIGILQMTIAEDSEDSEENQEILKLRQENNALNAKLQEKSEENKRLNAVIKTLRDQIRVLKAKNRVDSPENAKSKWDRSFEGLYNRKIRKYL